ncbi:MAG: hypothetical protein ACOZAO_00395 [Patescibacteria group bacterium]
MRILLELPVGTNVTVIKSILVPDYGYNDLSYPFEGSLMESFPLLGNKMAWVAVNGDSSDHLRFYPDQIRLPLYYQPILLMARIWNYFADTKRRRKFSS